MIMSWAVFLKSMFMMSKMELNAGNFLDFAGLAFVVLNLYAAQFAIAH